MRGVERFSDYLKEQLKDEEFRNNFEEEGVYADLAIQVAKLREKEGLSQVQLAKILKTTQQTVSRLEDPGNNSLSLATLLKLARAFRKNLKIQFV